MMKPDRWAACAAVTCVIVSIAVLTGSSSTSSTSGTTSTVGTASTSATTASMTNEQRAYCTAVTTWGTSEAATAMKAAVATGDPVQVKAAMKAYSAETQSMVDSVPASAPATVKVAYANINTAVKNSAAGTVTKEQSAALTAASPVVAAYYGSVCN